MFLLQKNQIRKHILQTRNNLTEKEKDDAEALIKQRFVKLISNLIKANSRVAIYYPIGSELDIIKIVKELSFQLLLPVINPSSKKLKFYPWKIGDDLTISNYSNNILEPKQKEKEIIPDIIIAPLIACDLEGNRIGSGKAMYDNTIADLRKVNHGLIYIGICYDFQIVDKIPKEEHDQKLDIILSETLIHFQ